MNVRLRNLLIPLFAVCSISFAQTGLTTTTSTNALTARGQGNSGSLGASGIIVVGSTTGMYAPGVNPAYGTIGSISAPNITYLLIDRELLRVNQVPSSTQVAVERGVQGTKATAHLAGATLYVMYANQLLNSDPAGSCGTAATYAYLPQYSFTTGRFFNCPTSGPTSQLWTITGTQQPYTWTDASFFVPAPGNCVASLPSGSAGSGNNTIILDGAVPALKASSTASAATLLVTCTIQVPTTRSTTGTGITVNSIDVQYSIQTTTATSQVLSTLGTFTTAAPAASETASSATLVAAGGTISQVPVVGSANLTSVSAGQYYTSRASLGTPFTFNTAHQTLVFTFSVAQSASAIQILTVPGLWVNAYSTDI